MKSSAVSSTSLALFCLAAIASFSAPDWLRGRPLSAIAQTEQQMTATAFFRDAQQRAVIVWYSDGSASLEYSDPWTGSTIYSTVAERQGDRLRFQMNNGSTIVLTGWNFQVANFAIAAPQGNYLAVIPYVSHYDRDNTLATHFAATNSAPTPQPPVIQPPAPTPQPPVVQPQPPAAQFPVAVATATEQQHGNCRRIVGFALNALYTNIDTRFANLEEGGTVYLEWSNFPDGQRGYCRVNAAGQVVEMKLNP